ncbi:MAG: lantibiotic dehydratase family protein [Bacteroidota bacterium]
MNNRIPYKHFSRYVLRTPLLSTEFYKKLTAAEVISDNDFQDLCKNQTIREAIFLASPSLHGDIERWLNHEITNVKDAEKIKDSLLKYVTRLCSRCTPFALFAGCAVGTVSDETSIRLKSAGKHKRSTRLDMNLLVAIANDIARLKHVEAQLKFFPNSSIYDAGRKLRYVDYRYVGGKRHHQILEVDNSTTLQLLLLAAKKGALLQDLIHSIDVEATQDEKQSFIDELVSCRLLVSELEPSVSGPEFLDQVEAILSKINGIDDLKNTLTQIRNCLSKIDENIGNDLTPYHELEELLKTLGTPFDIKFMVQTDMTLSVSENAIDAKMLQGALRGLALINKISVAPPTTALKQFTESMYERFEQREVPLAKALDVEIGVGYVNNKSHDINPLVDTIVLPPHNAKISQYDIRWNSINTFFQKKLIDAYAKRSYTVTLKEDDFKNLDADWSDLPDTVSVMMEVIVIDGRQKLKFTGFGGSSAANLLGRFSLVDNEILSHLNDIVEKESEINQGKVLAEVVHLPESRAGNILMRPSVRKYEIPYLAKSLVNTENQIPLDDLYVKAVGPTSIVLRSARLNKEIIPRLTNAHNFNHNSLPVYHFLCDMQTQRKRFSINMNWGPFANEFSFLPRIEYEDLILHDATWNLKKADVEPMLAVINDHEQLKEETEKFRGSKQIPAFALLVDGDQELLINFANMTSVRMFLRNIRKRDTFRLTEYLFADDATVRDENNQCYSNQIIVSFYNESKLKKQYE